MAFAVGMYATCRAYTLNSDNYAHNDNRVPLFIVIMYDHEGYWMVHIVLSIVYFRC